MGVDEDRGGVTGGSVTSSRAGSRQRRIDSVVVFLPDLKRLCSGDCIKPEDSADIDDRDEPEWDCDDDVLSSKASTSVVDDASL